MTAIVTDALPQFRFMMRDALVPDVAVEDADGFSVWTFAFLNADVSYRRALDDLVRRSKGGSLDIAAFSH